MKRRVLTGSVITLLLCVCKCALAQFNGTNWAATDGPNPNALGATGWASNTGQFPTGVPWQWLGSFTWTSVITAGATPPAAPVASGQTGTTTIDFSNLATSVLPSNSWLYFGDLDNTNGPNVESTAVTAWDSNGNQINTTWLRLPQRFWGNTVNPRPTATFAAGVYTFTGGNANGLMTLAFQTNTDIRTLRVQKNHPQNGFGIAAPREVPFQGREELVRGCCPENRHENVVKNMTFRDGNVNFSSTYTFKTAGPLAYGDYGIFNGGSVFSRLGGPPFVVDEVTNTMSQGSFLVGRVTNTPKVLWRQTINVPQGELVACVRLKPFYGLPSWPPVNVTFKFDNGTTSHSHSKPWWPLTPPNAWHDFTASFHHWVSAPVTVEILVDSPAAMPTTPHPIYLALDNIAVKPKSVPVPNGKFGLNIATSNLNFGNQTYNVTVTNWPSPAGFGYFWNITDITNSVPLTIQNPSQWWFATPPATGFNFPGYDGISAVGSVSSFSTPPGVFYMNRNYRIDYGMWGKCEKWTLASWNVGYFSPAKKQGPPEIIRLKIDPNAKPPRQFNPAAFDEKMRPNKAPDSKLDRANERLGRGGT